MAQTAHAPDGRHATGVPGQGRHRSGLVSRRHPPRLLQERRRRSPVCRGPHWRRRPSDPRECGGACTTTIRSGHRTASGSTSRTGPDPTDAMDVWRVRPSGGSPERLTEQRHRREFPGAARRAHAALRRARGGSVGTVAVGARCRAQGDSPRELGPRAIHVGVGQSRRPARRRHRRQPHRQPVARAAARSSGRGSRRPTVSAADGAGAGAALRRDIVVLFVRPRDGRWAVADPGRAGARSPEGRGRGAVRAARGVAGRKPRGRHRQTGGKAAPVDHVGGRQELTDAGPVHRRSKERSARAPPTGRRTARGSSQAARDAQGPGLFKIPVDGGVPVRLVTGQAVNPVWSPDGNADCVCRHVLHRPGRAPRRATGWQPRSSCRPCGPVRAAIASCRNGTGLVYLPLIPSLDFWLLDFATKDATSAHAPQQSGRLQTRSTSRLTANRSCSTARGRTRTSS